MLITFLVVEKYLEFRLHREIQLVLFLTYKNLALFASQTIVTYYFQEYR